MPAESQTVLLDSLYDEMDNAIAHHDDYLNKRIERIDQLKSSLSETSNEVQRYELLRKIVDEYIPYRIDSTLIYLNECKHSCKHRQCVLEGRVHVFDGSQLQQFRHV